jgi:DegV family protein with EDD domain
MARIRVVTDSTADIPEELRREAGIEMVPLSVNFGNESLLDKVDISSAEFVRRLTTSKALPTTAQPPPGLFAETYARLADEGAEGIVSIHLSEKLSGTIGSARIAAEEVADRVKVEVVDSRSVSLGLGFPVLEAARAAAGGADLETIVATVTKMIPNMHIIFFPDTLEYLQKGGRIGRAAMVAGSILSLKPLMRLDEGVVVPHERTRTRSKAIDGLVNFARDFPHIRQMGALRLGESDMETLLTRLNPIFPREKILVIETSPVIGVHLGPGALGVIIDAGEGAVPAKSA